MAQKMLIDATHPEETRVVVVDGNKVEEFDFESINKRQLAGNIYLAKVTRVEPSLQAAFVDYGGNRHGFLAFAEIHPDYYQIPVADRERLIEEQAAEAQAEEAEREAAEDPGKSGKAVKRRRRGGKTRAKRGGAESPADSPAETQDQGQQAAPDAAAREEPAIISGATAPAQEVTAPAGAPEVVAPEIETPEIETPGAEAPTPDAAPAETAQTETAPPRPVAATAPDDGAAHMEASDDEGTPGAGDSDASDEDGGVDDTPTPRPIAESAGSDTDERVSAEPDDYSDAPAEPGREARAAPEEAATVPEEVESVGAEDITEEIATRRPPTRRYKIQEVIKVRQILLVQVVKEERGNKGAALTTYLSLPGRYCVLMPNTARGGGISRKITSAADRKKLREIAGELEVPKGAGLIIRTAGSERTKAEIKRDYDYLIRQWDEIRTLTLQSVAPTLIYEEGSLIKRAIRDYYNREIDEVLVEGEQGYAEARNYMKMLMPSHARNVKRYDDPIPLFSRYQAESYLASMFNPVVQLKSGGYIVIGVTEALVAIDINSGRSTREHSIEETALKTNLEAAEEIARQLRLRDLAGLIVIDFIDMEERRNNASVEKRLKEKLKSDRARIQIGRISAFGLLEMSRQRLRPGILETITTPCPHCHGTGLIRSDESLALTILRELEDEGVRQRAREVLATAPVGVANYLINQKRDALGRIEARYGISVRVECDPALVSPEYRIERFKTASRVISLSATTAPITVDSSVSHEEEEEDDLLEPEVEAEAEAVAAAPAEAGGAEARQQAEGGSGRKRRRRRRRRGSGGETRDEEMQQDSEAQEESGRFEAEDAGDASQIAAAVAPVDAATETASEAPADAVSGPGAATKSPDAPTPPKRRSRRKATTEDAMTVIGAEEDPGAPRQMDDSSPLGAIETATETATETAAEAAAEAPKAADPKARPAKPRVRRRKPKEAVAETATTGAATPVPDAPEAAAPEAPAPVPDAPEAAAPEAPAPETTAPEAAPLAAAPVPQESPPAEDAAGAIAEAAPASDIVPEAAPAEAREAEATPPAEPAMAEAAADGDLEASEAATEADQPAPAAADAEPTETNPDASEPPQPKRRGWWSFGAG